MERIVAATDFSEDAGNAVRRSALLARRHGAGFELLHVIRRASLEAVREWVRQPPDFADRLAEDTRRVLEQSAAAAGAPATARLAVGEPVEVIAASCADGRVVAVGAHGLNPLRDAILGTTAERLVGRCGCAVLVVRKPPQGDYRNVLAAVDLLPGSEAALALAVAIAPGAKMAAVHAFDVPFEAALERAGVARHEIDGHRAAAFQKALGTVRSLSAAVAGDPDLFLPIVERGYPARRILEHEHGIGADLIVIGKRSRSAAEALILGSTTRHVLADASCDVLVVPLTRSE